MRRSRQFKALAALFAALALVLQGCIATPLRTFSPEPSAESNAATPRSSSGQLDFSLPTDLPSGEPAPASAAPTATPAMDSVFTVNEYSASDGKSIFYFSQNGVHRMDADGCNDWKTGITDCYEFLAINADGLYYLSYDKDYAPTGKENEWQYCNSFNFMLYNLDTHKAQTLMQHVLCACVFEDGIFAVDHMNHSHILRFDLGQRAFSDITGFPSAGDASDDVGVWAYKGILYLNCWIGEDYKLFTISGDSISTSAVVQPDFSADTTNAGYKIDFDNNGAVSIWTGSAFTPLDLTNVNDVIQYNNNYYITTYDGNNVEMLYEASMDGTVKHIAGPVTGSDESVQNEIIAGWYFSFGVGEDGGTANALLMKYRIG